MSKLLSDATLDELENELLLRKCIVTDDLKLKIELYSKLSNINKWSFLNHHKNEISLYLVDSNIYILFNTENERVSIDVKSPENVDIKDLLLGFGFNVITK